MCSIALLNVRINGKLSVVEEKRTYVDTRTPSYANLLCKTHSSKIFCLRFVCNDNKLLALNKYYVLEMLAFCILTCDTILTF